MDGREMLVSYANYLWRLFATGLCFLFFGFGGFLLSFIVFPLQGLIYQASNTRKLKARRTVHYSFKCFVLLLKYTGVASFHFSNKEQLLKLRGHVVMANHPSLIDVVVLISLIKNADCIVKADLFRNPFIKKVLKNTGYISNASPDGLLEDCNKSLSQGNNLIIFPEGTRTTPNQVIKFQRGAANIVLRCKASITTVVLRVSPTTLTKAEKWYQIPNKRFAFYLTTNEQTPLIKLDESEVLSKRSRQLTASLQAHFIEELGKNE